MKVFLATSLCFLVYIYTILRPKIHHATIQAYLQGAEDVLRNPPKQGQLVNLTENWPEQYRKYAHEPFTFQVEIPESEVKDIYSAPPRHAGGRTPGKLTASYLPEPIDVEKLMPKLRRLKRAKDRKDGSFAEICEEYGWPIDRTYRWVRNYVENKSQ